MSDVAHLLIFLFQGSSAGLPCADGSPRDAANSALLNTNGDVVIDHADALYNLNYFFLTGPPPVQGTGCVEIIDCPDGCGL